MTCGVFASVFVFLLLCLPFSFSICPCFYLVSSFLCLSSCPLFVISLCGLFLGLLFLFPFRTIRKKKGRSVLVRPLLSCCCVAVIWLRLCIPRTRPVSARLYRNKVLEKGNPNECSKLFCALRCSCLCSSKFVFLLFSFLLLLVGSYFLFPFRFICSVPL